MYNRFYKIKEVFKKVFGYVKPLISELKVKYLGKLNMTEEKIMQEIEARKTAKETMRKVKEAMKLNYFN